MSGFSFFLVDTIKVRQKLKNVKKSGNERRLNKTQSKSEEVEIATKLKENQTGILVPLFTSMLMV